MHFNTLTFLTHNIYLFISILVVLVVMQVGFVPGISC